MTRKTQGITAADVALVGMMVAVIEACKFALMALPNIELTSFWIVMFALCFGRRVYLAIPVFITVEGLLFGFGLWWFSYLYVWPILALVTWLLRGMDSALGWAIVSGAFGLSFGALCAVSYGLMGMVDGIGSGLRAAFAWWVAGIPFDLLHGAGNFALMLALYRPVRRAAEFLRRKYA